jgi:antitoxin component YwqK of YwqJK toxin-antitoxin module
MANRVIKVGIGIAALLAMTVQGFAPLKSDCTVLMKEGDVSYSQFYDLNSPPRRVTVCHSDGQKAEEGEIGDGKKQGQWTYWHENGNKWSEGKYVDGKQHGQWAEWHDNGNKRAEGEFYDDEKHGEWTYWDENGEIVEEN